MKENSLFFDITKKEQDSAVRYLLGAILKCRKKEGLPSNRTTFDEDVNIYLAHLLFAVSLPQYHEMADPYLSMDTSDVMRWIRETEDRTLRYFIYKVNADHILVHSAIFDDLGQRPAKVVFRRSKRHFQELARLYYDQAANYHKRIYRKKTAVGDVLGKLSQHFDSYQIILSRVRKDYFHFVESFRDEVFQYFAKEVSQYEGEWKKKQLLDRFLELYGKWLETKNAELEGDITRIARELEALDPEFHFDIERQFGPRPDRGDEKKCA